MRTENDSNKEGRPVDTMEPLDHTRGVKFLSAVRKALRRHSESHPHPASFPLSRQRNFPSFAGSLMSRFARDLPPLPLGSTEPARARVVELWAPHRGAGWSSSRCQRKSRSALARCIPSAMVPRYVWTEISRRTTMLLRIY